MRRPTAVLFLPLLFLASPPCPAIIFHSTGDPAYNTNAPAGTLTNSGWQYTGKWGDFMGTVIGPGFFITAKHIVTPGTHAGDPFTFQGQTYTALTNYDDPGSDLRIWRVCGTFPPPYAPLHTAGIELNKPVIVMGRGTQRGAEVRAGLNSDLKGWRWGAYDTVQRWGSNYISTTPVPIGPGGSDMLVMRFNAGAGADESHISYGDSSGPVFVKEGTIWKLGGINYGADGFYTTSTNGSDPGFFAAVFDESSLFKQVNQVWVTNALPTVGAFYSTRIATRASWITNVLNQPTPPDPNPVIQSAMTVNGAFADEPAAAINTVTRTITLPASGTQRFYRLRACAAYRFTQITLNDGVVTLTYE